MKFKKLSGILAVGMIFTLLILMIFVPFGFKQDKNEKLLFRNEQCIIVGTNESAQDFTHDKFHRPIVIKVWLVQSLRDTTQYAELSSYPGHSQFYITKEMWYAKSIGDTIIFDYIRKDKFFTIKK